MANYKNITPGGYAQYVEVDLGSATMITISGQVAMDANGIIVGINDFEQQAEHIFSSIGKILNEAGGSINDIVKLTNYLIDINNLATFKKVRDKYTNTSQPPASTTLQVSKFVREELLLEIEALAIIKK